MTARQAQRYADTPSLFRAHGNPARRPRVASLLPRMLGALDNRGWVSARRLSAELDDVDDRALREAASRSQGRILGGRLGYARTEQASIREVERVVNFLIGQSRRMKQRAVEILRVKHGSAAPLPAALTDESDDDQRAAYS